MTGKTGDLASSTVHVLTVMVGAGLLGMPLAIGNLGWVAGMASVFIICFVSLLASKLLTSVYEVNGVQLARYYEAVGHILGKKSQKVAAAIQLLNLFLTNIAFTITAATAMQSIANITCNIPTQDWGTKTKTDSCFNEKWGFLLMFGAAELVIVQVGDLEKTGWLSVVGVACSSSYSTIVLGLCIARVAQGNHFGTVGGITYGSSAAKAFAVLSSLGTICFAFSCATVLLEVEDTIREPPKAVQTMHKAVNRAFAVGCLIYSLISLFGYLALGDATPGNVLTAFDSPKWLLILTNLLVVVQMLASYNVVAQTFLLTGEEYAERLLGVLPNTGATCDGSEDAESEHKMIDEQSPVHPELMEGSGPGIGSSAVSQQNLRHRTTQPGLNSMDGDGHGTQGVHLHWKARSPIHHYHKKLVLLTTAHKRCMPGREDAPTLSHTTETERPGQPVTSRARYLTVYISVKVMYVLAATVLAVVMPFFSEILGLIGGVIFWPLTIYFPFIMYIKVHRPSRTYTAALYGLMFFMLLIAAGATIGAFRNMLTNWASSFCFTC